VISSLQQAARLAGLRGRRTVRSASALTFAAVLARIGAAALSLAIVLAFAGVFVGVGSRVVLCNQQRTGVWRCTRSGSAALLAGLCVQADSRAAEQTCKRSGEGEGICGTVLHK
jgi:hypothetical protein